MLIKDIEQRIIEVLKSQFKDIFVCGFPDKPQEFVLTHPTGALLVHYQGGQYSSKSESLDMVIQDKKMDFSITVVSKNLRSHFGAYELIDGVKRILTGFKIDGCSKFIPVKEGFISENNGIWQYFVNFSTSIKSIELIEESPSYGLKNIKFAESVTGEEI